MSNAASPALDTNGSREAAAFCLDEVRRRVAVGASGKITAANYRLSR